MDVILVITIYLVAVNLAGFGCMGYDKWKAKKGLWRIPEATLFTIAVIGGSLGCIIGMNLFHHKTRHKSFVYGMPAILILQIAAVAALLASPVNFQIMSSPFSAF